MQLRRLLVAGALCALAPLAAAAGNAVLFWNEQLINTTRLSRNPPPLAALHLATFHAAIFDTVNGIARTHRGWCVDTPAPAGADTDAAVAAAARTVLLALWGQAANPRTIETAYAAALADIPDGPAKAAGLAWGRQVAEAVLAARAASGWDRPQPGDFASPAPGKWRETPPGFRPPVLPHLAHVTPFVLRAPDQFRAPPPPALDSPQYAEELAFVARFGAREGSERSEYQTLSTLFWSDDLGSATPPGHWNVIACDLARRRRLAVPECARLFALLNLACADTGIACWDTKFCYRTWRPETALRELTPALNPRAVARPDFIPLMTSPAFPAYPSGHSAFSAAAARVLERFFGTDAVAFTTTSDGLPGAVRTYQRFSDARAEIGMSRLWGGIHTMADNVEGQNLGRRVADWVCDHALLARP